MNKNAKKPLIVGWKVVEKVAATADHPDWIELMVGGKLRVRANPKLDLNGVACAAAEYIDKSRAASPGGLTLNTRDGEVVCWVIRDPFGKELLVVDLLKRVEEWNGPALAKRSGVDIFKSSPAEIKRIAEGSGVK